MTRLSGNADIDVESCEAEKTILQRRLSESASEVERWVRNFKMLKIVHLILT
jgi:hypothetical protein